MSYDISFKVKVEGIDKWVEVGDCYANITYNVRKMIEVATGLPWVNEANNGYCKDVIPHIAKGWADIVANPSKYKPYESPSGWGTVGGVRDFFGYILEAWKRFCDLEDEELVNVTTFWIE